jgi:L-alanine-DL-glutamate epimerase-like enolase superfamily enzyme
VTATSSTRRRHPDAVVEALDVRVCTIPTEEPEADGTLAWDATTIVLVQATAGGAVGLGYAYADAAAASMVDRLLADVVVGRDALAVPAAWQAMVGCVRNVGRHGIAAGAISAVDNALWDLKARLLDLPLVDLLGAVRHDVPVYASGGFTSESVDRLREQLGGWAADGHTRVKMKVGTDPDADPGRVQAAREAVGDDVELYVDANGGYDRKQALAKAQRFAEVGVTWFEEPVSSDDLAGLRLLRDRMPAPIEVTAGEYGYDTWYFRDMLAAGAVDVLQPDATRCLGITGFVRAAALAQAFGIPISAHTAPALHVHPCAALPGVRHLEWFWDHVRIEGELFDGAPEPADGVLRPSRDRPGLGLELKVEAAERYAA